MLETNRLLIIPLEYDMLSLYLEAEGKLEQALKLTVNGRTMDPEIRERAEIIILPKMKSADPAQYLFYTFWLIVEKCSRTIVAELGFKGESDQHGEIEIGYGTFENQRGKGFMSEAIAGMLSWATDWPGISSILAETAETNLSSIRVVQKNNFVLFDKRMTMLWWRADVKPRII